MHHSDFDHTVQTSRETTAPASAVWAVLAQLDRLAAWAPGIDASSIVTEAAAGVGTVRRVLTAQFGEIEQVMKVWQPGRSLAYATQASGPFAATYTSYEIDASAADNTRIMAKLSFDLHPGTIPPAKATAAVSDGLTGILKALDAQARSTTDGAA